LRLFKRKPKFEERRSMTPENLERRRVFDAHDKKVVDMQLAEVDRRKQGVDARVRALQVRTRQLRS